VPRPRASRGRVFAEQSARPREARGRGTGKKLKLTHYRKLALMAGGEPLDTPRVNILNQFIIIDWYLIDQLS